MSMPNEKKDDKPVEDNSTEKKTPEEEKKGAEAKAEAKPSDDKSEEEKAADKEAKEMADKKAVAKSEKDKADTANTKEQNQKLQSQVDKIRTGAEDKKAQLEAQLESTEDPADKLAIERSIFELEKGLFDLDRETSAGTSLTSKVTSTLSELGYANDSEVAKKLFAVIETGGDGVESAIETQLDLLKSIGPQTKKDEEKPDDKKPADIDAGKNKGTKPDGDNTASIKASDFGEGGDKAAKAAEKLENFMEELAEKTV